MRAADDNENVADQLTLSIWLARASRSSRVRQFEKLLRLFPFSQREQPQSVISIHGVDSTEPPLLERPVNGPLNVDEVVSILADYSGADVAYSVESWWDLWQYETDWALGPARVALHCFGSEFDAGTEREGGAQEDLRIEFGADGDYLPRPEIEGSTKLVESNIKSLLRLVHELESALPVEKRRLETESGENFADRLQQALTASSRVQ